jgi:Protein of unknown function (DUF3311)
MTSVPPSPRTARPRWNGWNLLLLVPLLFLLTPIFNHLEPHLFGLPFFYWFQLAGVFVGVIATAIVYLMTKDDYVDYDRPDRLDVDNLDEGSLR